MGAFPPSEPSSTRLLSDLKDLVDPHRILAPGRYEPSAGA